MEIIKKANQYKKRQFLVILLCGLFLFLSSVVYFVSAYRGVIEIGENLEFEGDLYVTGDASITGAVIGYAVPSDVKWTSTTRNGSAGGYQGMYNWIQVNGCEGYHVCDGVEIMRYQAQHGPIVGMPASWYFSGAMGMAGYHECNAWTTTADVGPSIAILNGHVYPSATACATAINVACCKY